VNGYTAISLTIERLAAEGVPPARLYAVEMQMTNLLADALKARRAAELLPKVGATITAERLGVCRATAYNLAKRAKSLVAA
jgi:hypothetical protein